MRIPYLFFLIVSLTFSQNKLTKSDVIGKWEVKVKVKQLLKEETKDLDMFEKMAVQLASGFAEDVLDTADIFIRFFKPPHFPKNNTALGINAVSRSITVAAFGLPIPKFIIVILL